MSATTDVFDNVAFYYVATAIVGTIMVLSTLYILLSNTWVIIFGDPDYIAVDPEDRKFQQRRRRLLLSQPSSKDPAFIEDEKKKEAKYNKSQVFTFKNLFIFFGWLLFFYLLSIRNNMNSNHFVTFEPYEILQIQYGATEQQIKKAYRKLSLKYHPDVHGDDTRAEAEQNFMLLTKAYYALTDPTTKDNYERYGNPDGANTGPATITYGLPAFLSDRKYEIPILIGYLILFITVPVFFVYRYFKSIVTDPAAEIGIATESVQWFLGELEPTMDCKRLVEVGSLAMEFRTGFNSSAPTPERLECLKTLIPKIQNLPPHKHAKIFYIMYGSALYHAWTQWIEVPEENQDDFRLYLKTVPKLHAVIAEIARSNRGMIPFMGAIDLIQSTIQRSPLDFAHPFWQFVSADFNQLHIKALFEAGINSLGALQHAPREEVIKILGCPEAVYDKIIAQMMTFPRLRLDLDAVVDGAEEANPKDILQIEYSLQRLYNNVTHQNPSEPVFFPVPNTQKSEALARRKAGLNDKGEKMTKEEIKELKRQEIIDKIDNWEVYVGGKKKDEIEAKVHTKENVPNVISNTYPFQKKEVWYIALFWIVGERELLIDSRVINNFGDSAHPLTGKLMIQLPEKPGKCLYRFVVRCDSYLGCDMARIIAVNVVDPDAEKKAKQAKKLSAKLDALEAKLKVSPATVELIEEEDVDSGEVKLVEDKNAAEKSTEDKEPKKKFLSPADLEGSDDSDEDDEEEEEDEEEEDIFQDQLEEEEPEAETYWYYLGGSSFLEGVINLIVFAIIGFLLYHYCHDKAWWKRWVQPIISKVGVLIKPYWTMLEAKVLPYVEPAYYKLEQCLSWFLGDAEDNTPMNIKLERAYNARGRRF